MSHEEFLEIRQEMGWTQYFLADAIGVTRASVAHWECGRAPVPSTVATAMRRAHKKMLQAKTALWAAA
jgi:transcriptional regulator with XRE-family HTH domain